MAITMNLYSISEDERVVGKSIPASPLSTHTITLKDGCSVDEPVVSLTASVATIASANYAYIDTFGRYYWIRNRKSLVNGVVELTLESDPWNSFASQLRNCQATITRNQNAKNGYLLDEKYQLLSYNTVVTREFPSGLTGESMLLMTVG